jgi:hypothetical protein
MSTKPAKRIKPVKRDGKSAARTTVPALAGSPLLADVRGLILQAREQVARAVDARLSTLHWHIGDRIRRDILKERRAGYGEQIMSSLATQLEAEFGRGFGRRNLFRMIRFAEVFPDQRIVSALMTQLGWTHFLHIIPIDAPLKRDFYGMRAWGSRTVGHHSLRGQEPSTRRAARTGQERHPRGQLLDQSAAKKRTGAETPRRRAAGACPAGARDGLTMPRRQTEITFQKHIGAFLIREHK